LVFYLLLLVYDRGGYPVLWDRGDKGDDTMTKDQFIFEKLEMGCWHRGKRGQRWECAKCGAYRDSLDGAIIDKNPSFSTWEGFGKLWEAVRKTDWWEEFKISPHPATIHECLINPTPFRNELADFLGWEEK